MSEQNLSKLGGQIANTEKSLRHTRVNRMCAKIELLSFDGNLDRDSINDILLRTIFDTNKSKSQIYVLTLDHSLSTGTFIHDIDFGDDTNGSNTFWVNLSCHL